MRVIVCGSRDWTDKATVYRVLDELPGADTPLVIVHGACQDKDGNLLGADRFADEWARERGIQVEPHPANWALYNLGAGPVRNEDMAYAGAARVEAFWNGALRKGKQPGTLDMIRRALQHGIAVHIHPPSTAGRDG